MCMKRFILVFLSLLIGCSQYIPKPAPMPCEIKVRGECREQSASERSGAVVRGHGEDVKETK